MFNYFTHAIVLIFIGYASTYPFFFWTTPLSKIDQGFYRFNLGKCCVVGSLGVIAYYFILPYDNTQLTAIIWLSMLTIITAFYWNSKKINNGIISFISALGCYSLIGIIQQFLDSGAQFSAPFSVLLGSAITAGVFFSMILGHWYLNVIQLPIKFLFNSTLALTLCLSIRSIWDIIYLSINFHIDEYGLKYSLWSFLVKFDGFLMLVGLLIGIIFPLTINFLAFKSIRLQATQSATGLLYVSIVSILFGDLIFKFYLFQYGFTL